MENVLRQASQTWLPSQNEMGRIQIELEVCSTPFHQLMRTHLEVDMDSGHTASSWGQIQWKFSIQPVGMGLHRLLQNWVICFGDTLPFSLPPPKRN